MNQALDQVVINQLELNGTLQAEDAARARELETDPTDNHGELRSLIDAGLIPERVMAECIANTCDLRLVNTGHYPTEALPDTDSLVRFLREHEALPLTKVGDIVELAVTDPSNTFIKKIVEAKLACKVKLRIAVRSELVAQLNRLYGALVKTPRKTLGEAPADLDTSSPLIREIHRLLQSSASKRASDIHFEPCANGLQVRFRIHGILSTVHTFSVDETPRVIARVKLMARLDVSEKQQPQTGRFQFPADGRVLDFRVSSLPLHNGESIVLRLLEARLGEASLEQLGFRNSVIYALEDIIHSNSGLLLVTGPTGSGKSTTLYSLLSSISSPELKLISIEDPVEISLSGVNQIQVNDEHGIGFAKALRSVLRQDPDVIMVGEIRDSETARLAAQAALTGHLVLSTLHTNSAAATLSRLRDLGLEDFMIDSTLKGVLAQRLLRTTCKICGENPETGCLRCDGSGYEGRTTIAEFLPYREQHTLHTPTNELNNQLLDGINLAHDARRLVSQGDTSLQEVLRVVGSDPK